MTTSVQNANRDAVWPGFRICCVELIDPNALSATIDAQFTQSLGLDTLQVLLLCYLVPEMETTLPLRFNVTHDCLDGSPETQSLALMVRSRRSISAMRPLFPFIQLQNN